MVYCVWCVEDSDCDGAEADGVGGPCMEYYSEVAQSP